MPTIEVIDPQDQRYVQATGFDRNGRPIAAFDERGQIAVSKEGATKLWWLKMMEIFKIPVLPRTWIYQRWEKRKLKAIVIGELVG